MLDAVGTSRAHLVGHSMGGAVALAVAARDPARIASLTLIAPSAALLTALGDAVPVTVVWGRQD